MTFTGTARACAGGCTPRWRNPARVRTPQHVFTGGHSANVQFVAVVATAMPFIGRG